MWLSNSEIDSFINSLPDLDISKSHSARWIDQKCTPDVLSIVSDCICEFVSNPKNQNVNLFTSQNIWHSKYTSDNVLAVFQKPNVNSKNAVSEYNKFFMQPMELLAYSHILLKEKKGNQNFYSITNFDVLKFISIRERNSLYFLEKYITKVLKDSSLYQYFDNFFTNQNKNNFQTLKDTYLNYIIANTPITKKTEPSRIFTKVLNPLAFSLNAKGTSRGNLSKNSITYDMLMYNRLNFRDIFSSKPKGLTRREFILRRGRQSTSRAALQNYLINKAKRLVREYNLTYNDGLPELSINSNGEKASNVHHIFPENEFPEIASYHENLICLNPTQHYNYAHPNGNTQRVDKDYQKLCLMAKSDTIQKDFEQNIGVYSFKLFQEVLAVGLDDEAYRKILENDYTTLKEAIIGSYLSNNI